MFLDIKLVTYLGECWSCHNVSSWTMRQNVNSVLSKADLSCLHPNLSFTHSFINPSSEFFPFPLLLCPANDEFYIVVSPRQCLWHLSSYLHQHCLPPQPPTLPQCRVVSPFPDHRPHPNCSPASSLTIMWPCDSLLKILLDFTTDFEVMLSSFVEHSRLFVISPTHPCLAPSPLPVT